MSRVGRKTIPIPKGVEVRIADRTVTVKGPKGELTRQIREGLELEVGGGEAHVRQTLTGHSANALFGLTRALINNMVLGVSAGFSKSLEIHGTGYRAQVQGQKLVLNLGYSHPIEYPLPNGIQAAVEQNRILLSGIDKELLGQVSAEIRRFRPPEPYKGKGVRYVDEHVRRKAGKSAGA
jgi:large subunit ribosomal protein L6